MECERPKPMLEEKITFFCIQDCRGREREDIFFVDIGMRIERERTGKMLKEQDVHGTL